MRSSRLIKNSKLIFKNKELKMKVYSSLLKFLNKKKIQTSGSSTYIKKIYSLGGLAEFKPLQKDFKGCSILTLRRRAFYSLFQLSRFDAKKLISERTLTGIKSAVW
jgi:hypothetical protein